ncbi:hypothetical protein WM16_08855 [Burkholderia ubonensis]|uniref:Uncharacterized protein n=1 Tax=Burkholderia ubonensis TaxID=101571 RepID=A0A119UWZ9_9BURK|nr:hypothetical protein WM16_08855 [Burkholderia ubonensis]
MPATASIEGLSKKAGEAPPSRFECLKCGVVQARVELPAELFVQVRQTPIEQIRIHAIHRIRICS